LLGRVPQLKYVNHNITDMSNFLELSLHEYLEIKVDPIT